MRHVGKGRAELAQALFGIIELGNLFGWLWLGQQTATAHEDAAGDIHGLIQCFLGTRIFRVCRLLRVTLGALGYGHHGRFGPYVNSSVPVEPIETASFDGNYVFPWCCVQKPGPAPTAKVAI